MYLITTREMVLKLRTTSWDLVPQCPEQQQKDILSTETECQAWANNIGAKEGQLFIVYDVDSGDWLAASGAGRTELDWF